MSGLTLAIVKRDTGKYSVLVKEEFKTGFFKKKIEVEYCAYPEYFSGGSHISLKGDSVWSRESKRFNTFDAAKTAALRVFEARNEAVKDATFVEVEELQGD